MKKIIISLISGTLILGLGIMILVELPEINDRLATAVYVDDGKLNIANEGKLVILAGRLEADYPFLDPVTGVTLPYFAAYRKAEVFLHDKGTDYEYSWYLVDWDVNDENIGVNSKKPTSSKLIAPSHLGDFNIDPRIFKEIVINDEWKDFTDNDLEENKYYIFESELDNKTYLSEIYDIHDNFGVYKGIKYKDDVGKMRYSYQIYDDKDPLDFTIIGIQKGDWLMIDDDLEISYIRKGIHSAYDFKGENLKENKALGLGASTLGTILLGLGAYFILSRKKEKEG